MPAEDRRAALLRMLASEPDDVFLNYALALEYVRENNAKEAGIQLKKVLELDAAYVPAYFQLGKLHEHAGEITNALKTFREGLELAKKQNNRKAASELEEAIFMLED